MYRAAIVSTVTAIPGSASVQPCRVALPRGAVRYHLGLIYIALLSDVDTDQVCRVWFLAQESAEIRLNGRGQRLPTPWQSLVMSNLDSWSGKSIQLNQE